MNNQIKSQVDNLVDKMTERDHLIEAGVNTSSANAVAFGTNPALSLAKPFRDQIKLVNSSVNMTFDSMLQMLTKDNIIQLIGNLSSTKVINGRLHQECFYLKNIVNQHVGICMVFTDPLGLNQETVIANLLPISSKLDLMEAVEQVFNSPLG